MNGRVTLDGTPGTSFHLFEEAKNPYDYKKSLIGIQSSTTLNKVFFSKQNVIYLHKMIIKRVSDKSGYKIGKQSDTELQVIMRSIYLQYGKNQLSNIRDQVMELNEKVLNYAVERITVEISQFLEYKNTINQMPMPLSHPQNLSNRGEKSLSLFKPL